MRSPASEGNGRRESSDDTDVSRAFLPSFLSLAAIVVLAAVACAEAKAPHAPPFPSASAAHWIGAPPTWESLRGRVVLLDVWTLG